MAAAIGPLGGVMICNAPFTRWPIRRSLATALLCLACHAVAADAQEVSVCDIALQMDKIASPEDLNVRHFANGQVLVAVVYDVRADAAQALSVLVVSPPLDEHGQRQCRLVGASDVAGYAALILDKADAAYDPAIGLTVSFPAVVMPTTESLGDKIDLAVTINQATGQITPVQIASGE
mgnify:CR=1 FL=1